ncbi:MAG: hypothetical protein AVDCRST_MAG56-4313 [uncultured Cytophagales bacterium]|uniref:Uncharacterized protein n=1 Tax=uncultured Cytophagales bacterium TaxID=158755 RepID=A0A6J4JV19_9SPHI|nr:MAG: hypothetical protein AVDCRST_MAG56-4313 [uncultured Cytophagales bacterium]
MIRRHLFTLLTAFTLLSSYSFAQTTPPATNKKFNVYKIDINPNGVKDGIRGIAVVFSCEYNFSDPEYAGMRDKEGKTNFTFYASITDKNNEPAYYASNYSFYRKLNQTTALHFATENAYAPQNKAQGRRNTGIELFIPYTHTTLPEGPNAVKFSLNALAEKGKRFDNIHTQNLTINRPAAYAATLVPKQITVIDKGGKRQEAGRLEQDLFVYPGSNKASADVSAMNNAELNQPVGFLYSEGDVLRLKLQKSTATGVVRSNKPRLLRTSDNKSMATFDNGGAIPGEWPLDPKSGKTVQLKNNGVDLKLELTQYRVPAVQLSGVTVNPHATYEGTSGTSVTFTTQANVAAALPPLEAWIAYQPDNAESQTFLQSGKVTEGKGKADSTGAVVLDRTATGKVTVFYPSFNMLLNDAAIRQNPPKQVTVQIRLQGNPGAIAQKTVRQDLPVNVIKEVTVTPVARVKDTVINNEHGVALSLAYQAPKPYEELFQGQRYVTLVGMPQDSRAVDLLRRMVPVDAATKPMTATDKKALSYSLPVTTGALRLFLPYTSITKIETTPLPFLYRAYVRKAETTPVAVGEGNSALRFEADRQNLKFVTLGIASVKFKKGDEGNIAWRIRTPNRTLYQSNPIEVDKVIENLYTDAFYIHQDDQLILELLKGDAPADMKVLSKWEMPVKSLKASEQPEMNVAGSGDADLKSVTVSYTTQ